MARVSTREQQEEGQSIPAQLRRLKEYAKAKHLQIEKIFEIAESSTKDTRKEFEKILTVIKASREPLALIVETVDRLQRSFKESIILDDYRKDGKIEIHFCRENLILTKNSNSADLLRWDMAVMFARSYVLQLSDNVKRSIEQKLKNGEWIVKAYIGYKNVREANGKRNIVPDPERAYLVKKVFELYATGNYSMRMLRKEMNKRGLTNYPSGKPLVSSQIEHMLNNRFYYGVMEAKGISYPHKYETIISKALFDKVQEVKESYNKKQFKHAKRHYVFRGLIQCYECGCTLTPEIKKGKYIYYHCTNYHGNCNNVVWVREKELLKQAEKLLNMLKMPPKIVENITSRLNAINKSESDYCEKNISRIEKELKRIRSRYEIMYEDRLDGRITPEMYDKKLKIYKLKESDLMSDYEQYPERMVQNFYVTSIKIVELVSCATEIFRKAKSEEKTQLLSFLVQNFFLKGQTLIAHIKTPFKDLIEYKKTTARLPRKDSNLDQMIQNHPSYH